MCVFRKRFLSTEGLFLSNFFEIYQISRKTIRRLVTAVSLMTATRLTQVYQTLKPAPLSILQDCCLPQDALWRTSTTLVSSYRIARSKFREMQSSEGLCFRIEFREILANAKRSPTHVLCRITSDVQHESCALNPLFDPGYDVEPW